MDRNELTRAFTLDRTPEWMCPTCGKGILILNKDSFCKDERSHSRDHSHEAWEPEWIEYVYSCLFLCSNANCGEIVASSGIGSVDWDVVYKEDGREDQEWYDYFRPRYFEPPLCIISVPAECPDTIQIPLRESFRQLFSSPNASANGVRIALENLLTELKISRYKTVAGKKRVVSLHERISNIPSKYSELRDLMLAVKWLGNAGSHGNTVVTIDDVFDAYEMTELVLQEVYAPSRKRLNALAKKVIQKKGPIQAQ